ncbi:MAG: NAD(P)-dependent oxidoreductase [Planctomycetota bacterium]|nr:NAD(P)-dependent oxidoreductase [Planctomycetota bacterium]
MRHAAAGRQRSDGTVKYCITGGSGFIGGYFCEALAAAGHDLTIFDLIDPPPGTPHARFVKGDVRDADACRAAFEGCDRVLHLAAAHHDFGIEHECYFSVNETASRTICDVMDELGVREICFYSTVAVYGDAPEPHHEEAPCRPNTPYGASKLAGEAIFRTWTERGEGRRCLVIRPTVTFGARNFANMYTLIRQIHQGRYFIVGKGENIKSLSYIENIVDATLFLWDRDGRSDFDVYDWVEKPDMTSMQITRTVYGALGKPMPTMRFPMWLALLGALPFDIVIALTGKNLPISSARIRKMCSVQTKFEADKALAAGFKPRVPLEEGIEKMVQWYLAEGKDQSADWHQPPTEIVRFKP